MKSKVYLSLLFCVLFAFALTFTVSATTENAITFTMEPSGSIVQAGETFTVDIVIPENTGFVWSQISVHYDADQVTFVADSSYASDDFGANTVAGTLSVKHRESVSDILVSIGNSASISNPANGVVYNQTGKVVTLTFCVAEGYEGPIDLWMTYNQKNIISQDNDKDFVVTVNDPVFKAVDCSKGHTPGEEATCTTNQICVKCEIVLVEAFGHTPGAEATCTENQICDVCQTVLVEAFGHTPGAEATCTESQICDVCQTVLVEALGHNLVRGKCTVCGYCEYILGDVNFDGLIDTTDAKLIMQLDLGLITEADLMVEAADVNGDGLVDTTDAKLIMQLDLGLITEFPIAN